MKKRKPPIFLVSFLVILVGVGLVYTMSMNRSDRPDTSPVTSTVDSANPEANTESMANAVKTATGGPQSPGKLTPTPAHPDEESHLPPSAPATARNLAPAKPKPNVTASQWWSSESMK